jgi:phenylalanyl-tRNA synthetase alpha chain
MEFPFIFWLHGHPTHDLQDGDETQLITTTKKDAIATVKSEKRVSTTIMTEACENSILTYLSTSPDAVIADTVPWAEESKLDHKMVVGVVKSLLAEGYVATEDLSQSYFTISPEAETILANGSQEMIVLLALEKAGKLSMPDLQAAVGKDIAKIGMGNCMKNKWVKKEGADLVPIKKVEELQDEVQISLKALQDGKFAPDAIDEKVRL